jgi:hypothetical protein
MSKLLNKIKKLFWKIDNVHIHIMYSDKSIGKITYKLFSLIKITRNFCDYEVANIKDATLNESMMILYIIGDTVVKINKSITCGSLLNGWNIVKVSWS